MESRKGILLLLLVNITNCLIVKNLSSYCSISGDICDCAAMNFIDFSDDVQIDLSQQNFSCNTFIYRDSNFGVIPKNALKVSPNMRNLVVENCNIETLFKWSFEGGENVTGIYLGHNRINRCPGEVFRYPTNVTLISLEYNFIETLEYNCFIFNKALEILNLNSNQIRSLPANGFSYLKSLRALNLHDNKIEFLPDAIFRYCTSLEELDLSHNNLKIIERNIVTDSRALTYMLGAFNQDTKITSYVFFSGLKTLKVLKLSNNYFGYIGHDTFLSMTSLEELYLSDMNLTLIESGAFTHQPGLSKIDLSHNKLERVNVELFKATKQLSFLDLSYNSFQEIDYQELYSTTNGTVIRLVGNRWNCSYAAQLKKGLAQLKVDAEPNIERGCSNLSLAVGTIGLMEKSLEHTLKGVVAKLETLDVHKAEHLRDHKEVSENSFTNYYFPILVLIVNLLVLGGVIFLVVKKRNVNVAARYEGNLEKVELM